jgi:hypothetical protein
MGTAWWGEMAAVEQEPAALPRSPVRLDPFATSVRVPWGSAQRPGRREHPRRRRPARGWGRPAPRRGSAARRRVRRRLPVRGPIRPPRKRHLAARGQRQAAPEQEQIPPRQVPPPRRPGPAALPWASPARWRDRSVVRWDRLACPLTPRVPRLWLRQPRGGWLALGGRAVAGPWAGALGERLGLRVHAVPVVASRRCGVAWAGRPWERALETSGRQERRGAMDDAAGVRQDRPGRAAHRVGPAVRRLDGFPAVLGSIPPEPVARRLGAAPPWPRGPRSAGPRRPVLAGPWRQARAELVQVTSVWPRSALLAWPPLVATVWLQSPRAVPRRAVPAWPRWVGSGEASGVGPGLPWARPVPFGTRRVGLANPEPGRGAVGAPRVGSVLVRMPGWTPIGRRGVALGPEARFGDLQGGR